MLFAVLTCYRRKDPRSVPHPAKLWPPFWDSRDIIFIDYLPRGQTISGKYYTDLIRKLRETLKQKRRGMLTKNVLLLHNNVRVHTCALSIAAIREAGFEALSHPLTLPTWLRRTIICSVHWRITCGEELLRPTMRCWQRFRPGTTRNQKTIFLMELINWFRKWKSVSDWKENIYPNK